MTHYFLGVDIGGTKSRALITDGNGRSLGYGISGGGNWEVVGWAGLRYALHECVGKALDGAQIEIGQVAGAGFGVAGYDWPEDREPICQIIESLSLTAPYKLANDAIIALLAGTQAGWGVAVVAGTGNNCRGRDRNGREGRVTGMSGEYREYGGASEIVMRGMQAVALAWTRRAPATRLSDLFLKLTGADNVEDLLAGVARGRYSVSASASPLVFQTACDGDPVAREIIRWAGRELGDLAVGVIRQLALENESFEVTLVGSTFNGSQVLKNNMEKRIQLVAPQARLTRLNAPPVIGGVLLGMEQVGVATAASRRVLLETAVTLVNQLEIADENE